MRKLNMNGSGIAFLRWGFFFSIGIPLPLYLIICAFGNNRFARTAMYISIAIGALIISILFLLVFIELRQDKVVDRFFAKNVNVKIKISDEYFECQSCGNKRVLKNQTYCTICGTVFKEKHKAPFNIFF